MTELEYMTEFSMWAIAASPLVVTTPIMNCTAVPAPPGPPCSVSLDRQTSQAKCTANQTFGCSGNAMWTDAGCRGRFTCNGVETDCDVDGVGRHTCACGGGAVKCEVSLSALQRKILFNDDIIAVNQDITPQGRPVVPGDSTVWARFTSNGSVAVALYNEGDTAQTIGLDFGALGKMSPSPVPSSASWTSSTSATARDLWKHASMGVMKGEIPKTSVPPHGTVMVLLTKA